MALRFNGSTGYLKLNAAIRNALPLSVVVYAGGSSPTGDGHVWSQSQTSPVTGFRLFTDSFGGNAYAGDYDGSSWNAVKSGVWNTTGFRLFATVFSSSTSRKVYHGSATPGTDTATAAAHISSENLFAIGCAIFGNSPSSFMGMDAAELHFYSVALSDADITSLLGGTKPEDIAGWVDGWQLKNTTDLTSMGGTRTLTLNGGVTNSGLAHPVTRTSPPVLSSPTAGTPGTTSLSISATTDRLSDGTIYFLRRVGGSPASAATIVGTGESQAVGGANPQTRVMSGFTMASANNYVDIVQAGAGGNSNVVSVGPFTMADSSFALAATMDPFVSSMVLATGSIVTITATMDPFAADLQMTRPPGVINFGPLGNGSGSKWIRNDVTVTVRDRTTDALIATFNNVSVGAGGGSVSSMALSAGTAYRVGFRIPADVSLPNGAKGDADINGS